MSKIRTAFAGQITDFTSPEDEEVSFGIGRIGNAEYISHQNLSSTVRYIQEENDQRFVSEKDYPVGSMRVDTVLLALKRWNIESANGSLVEINKDNLLAYTSPTELNFLHDKVMEVNPILTGKDAAKNDSQKS